MFCWIFQKTYFSSYLMFSYVSYVPYVVHNLSCFLIPSHIFSFFLLFLMFHNVVQFFSSFLLFLVWFISLYFLLTSITHQKSCFHRFCEPEFSSIKDKTYLCPKFVLCPHISSKKKESQPTFYQK